jgi:ABC-type transport system involved in multi-copper enzyme maturation permease subunit
MRWLLWKDYRVNRAIAILALALFVVPHLFALYSALNPSGPYGPFGDRGQGVLINRLLEAFSISELFGLTASQVLLAVLGGNMIAGERTDRSAEFLAYLPVTRGKIITSKILVAGWMIALIWLPNLLLLLGNLSLGPGLSTSEVRPFLVGVGYTLLTGLVFFCVAWCFSSMLSSPTYSAGAGLIAPILVAGALLWIGRSLCNDTEMLAFMKVSYLYACLPLAPLSFVAGTWYYLRRVEA